MPKTNLVIPQQERSNQTMIQLNGESIEGYENKTIADLITDMHYDITKIAVEQNGSIIPKSKYKTSVLNDNDVLEVVTFVGGG